MPLNKKRRKPAHNSARGFATTSTPSKSKVDDEKAQDNSSPVAELQTSAIDKAEPINSFESAVTEKLQKELHELTPEELEFHLEESNLQLLLEEYGEKCKKDAVRQFNRVTTEQRVLRPQSELLDISFWLSDDLIQEILDLLNVQTNMIDLDNQSVRVHVDSEVPESKLIIRLWTLEKVLGHLGFKENSIRLALQVLLKKGQPSTFIATKEPLWGLDECFGILTLMCGSEEIPSYELKSTDCRSKINKVMQRSKRYEEYS